jgi:hypothetical protein
MGKLFEILGCGDSEIDRGIKNDPASCRLRNRSRSLRLRRGAGNSATTQSNQNQGRQPTRQRREGNLLDNCWCICWVVFLFSIVAIWPSPVLTYIRCFYLCNPKMREFLPVVSFYLRLDPHLCPQSLSTCWILRQIVFPLVVAQELVSLFLEPPS